MEYFYAHEKADFRQPRLEGGTPVHGLVIAAIRD
jgi:hypothetical protein